jgi:hypothetical protein
LEAVDQQLSSLDFQRFGSLNLMVTQFPRLLRPYDFLNELSGIWTEGGVRADAFIFLRRDKDGHLMGMEGSRMEEDEDIAAMNAVLAALAAKITGSAGSVKANAEAAVAAAAGGDFGLSRADIEAIARRLPAGYSAIIILFENVWERRFKTVARKYGGELIKQRLISSADLTNAARELATTGEPSAN